MGAIVPAVDIIFWGVVTFSLLVVLHEGGHFLAARLFGVRVHEFMIGLPGPAIRLHTKHTAFGITAIPLGGYVRIAGMEPGAEDPLLGRALKASMVAGRVTPQELATTLGTDVSHAESLLVTLADWGSLRPVEGDPEAYDAVERAEPDADHTALLAEARKGTYRGLPTWKRISVLAMGVLVNLAAAILTFTLVLAIWGYYVPSLTLESVQKGSAAAAAGIRGGDRLVSLDGDELSGWEELITKIADSDPGERIVLGVRRDGAVRQVPVTVGEHEGRPFLGIASGVRHERPSVIRAATESLRWTGMVFVAIGRFFRPSTFAESVRDARSVVGISVEVRNAVRNGPLDYAWLVALLSLSLGAMNILPIPPLDGGKIVMEVLEKVMGHPLRREVSLAISAVGTLLLFVLIGYLMYADVVRYIVKG